MRTTINLDNDMYELASIYATARDVTIGTAIGEMMRKAYEEPTSESSRIRIAANGLPILPSQGRKLTSEMVKAASEDEID